jgi:hypothetical protein
LGQQTSFLSLTESSGNVNSNLKAWADHGWSPPNRKLIEHKELIDDSIAPIVQHTLTDATYNNSSEGSISLNVHQGWAANVLDQMIAEQARSSQAKKQQMRGRGKVIGFCNT